MPVRRRRHRRNRLVLTRELHLALTIGPSPVRDDALTDALLCEVYAEHRARLLRDDSSGHRPWAFWRFEDVPEPLRATRPELVAETETDRRHREDTAQLEDRRRAWLAEHENGAYGATTAPGGARR